MPKRPTASRRRKNRGWLPVLLKFLAAWRRRQAGRVVVVILLIWLAGATGLHLAERATNPAFATWGDAFWNVWLLLFSEVSDPPKTVIGRTIGSLLLACGVVLIALFTAGVASYLIERSLRRREMSNQEMSEHLVLCNWSSRGLEWGA